MKILTIIAGIILAIDFIAIMSGVGLTMFGLITGFINLIILGIGCDYLGI